MDVVKRQMGAIEGTREIESANRLCNADMVRRAAAKLLLVIISLPLMAVLLSAQTVESQLPQCCRRFGAHRCLLAANHTGPTGVALHAASTCSMFQLGFASTQASDTTGAMAPVSSLVAMVSLPSAIAKQAEVQYRISYNRSSQKRGPPSDS